MARFIGESNTNDILSVAEEFKQTCLLEGKSLFSDESIWQLQYLKELKALYVDNELLDNRDFFEKLKEQLSGSLAKTVLLAAEIYWFMMLCPRGSISIPTKVANINKILMIKTDGHLPYKDNYLSEKYMIGIGSPGTAFFTQIWKEFKFAILFFLALFEQSDETKKSILSSNKQFTEFFYTIEKKNNPQFRYMLLYLFFPDENERVFSSTGRQLILSALTNIPLKAYTNLTLFEINSKLLEAREKLEREYHTKEIDFYIEPYKERWANLENEFKKWVKSKVKSDGTEYSENSMKLRYKALKEGISKLNIKTKTKYLNVFNYTDLEEFLVDENKIRNADNFKEINEKYSNGGLSAGISQYKAFLKERLNTFEQRIDSLEQEYRDFLSNRNEGFKSGNQYVNSLRRTITFSENEVISSSDIFKIDNITSFDKLKKLIEEDIKLQVKIEELNNQFGTAFIRYREFLLQRNQDENGIHEGKVMSQKTEFPKNQILYGPPGTGKTYSTIICTIAIIDERPLNEVKEQAKTDYDTLYERFKELKEKGQVETITFHQSYGYEEFIEGIKPVMENDQEYDEDSTQNIQYKVTEGVFKEFCERAKAPILHEENELESVQLQTNNKKYVFIIDEINRGNISKIFGELITLIEESKRLGAREETTVKLPYSPKPFGVPNNVYLLGTMNTADRSIARLDTALRRRFNFIEMLPDSSVLEGVEVEGIDIKILFENMNKKIAILYDREHTIGHSYFIPLIKNATLKKLASIFRHEIIPLLQEYFYDDYAKIQAILGDNRKNDSNLQFIIKNNQNFEELFGEYSFEDEDLYEINDKAFDNIESYRLI